MSTACITVTAQHPDFKKFTLALSAGPSFPVGPFGSKDYNNNPEAGLAKTGYNLNAQLGYYINEDFGIGASLIYSKYLTESMTVNQIEFSADHWQYYGLLIGPLYSFKASKKFLIDVKSLFGLTNVNSPAFTYHSQLVIKEDWAFTFALQLAVAMRYYINQKVFLLVNCDYVAMNPMLQVTAANGSSSVTAEQKIGAVNLTGGIGIRF